MAGGLLLAIMIWPVPAAAQAAVTFNVGMVEAQQFPKINLLVSFYRNGQLMDEVEAGNVEVIVNDTKQANWTISSVKKSREKIAIVFVIDRSRLVPPPLFEDLSWVLTNLVNRKGRDDMLGVIAAANKVEFVSPLSEEGVAFVKAVESLSLKGDKALLYDAAAKAINLLRRKTNLFLKYVLVISAATDQGSAIAQDELISLAKSSNIPISVVGLFTGPNRAALNDLSRVAYLTGGVFVEVKDKQEMLDAYSRLASAMLKQHVIGIDLGGDFKARDLKLEIAYKTYTGETVSKIIPVQLPPMEASPPSQEPAAAQPRAETAKTPAPVKTPPEAKPAAKEGQPGQAGTAQPAGGGKGGDNGDKGANYAYYYLAVIMGLAGLAMGYKSLRRRMKKRKLKPPTTKESQKRKPAVKKDRNDETIVCPIKETVISHLEFQDGGRIFQLNKPSVTLGTSAENDLVISDRTVSRRHAQMSSQDGKWRITDLNSTNGVFVNGKRVKDSIELNDGDKIVLGSTEMTYVQKIRKQDVSSIAN